MDKTPTPPKHLRPSTKQWWSSVVAEFELEPHHIRLLTLAAESWDRCVQAREALEQQGLTFTDKHGQPKARPEVVIERDSRIAFARLLRELALDVDPLASESRPPLIGGKSNLRIAEC